MRKILLLLMLMFRINGVGQTYTFKYEYKSIPSNCPDAIAVNYNFWGDNLLIAKPIPINSIYTISDLPICNNLILKKNSNCRFWEGHPNYFPENCKDVLTVTKSFLELIKGDFPTVGQCLFSIRITEFKPNVNISNTNGSTICSGEQLELAGFPIGFPDEAYHWQYSKDNQVTWIDVPSSIGSNPKTNDTPQTAFSINNLLGSTSEQYFNKTIYFRLGYGQDRPFTGAIPITFSPCAPVINNLQALQPNCSGNPMTVIVTFDRPLDLTKNEKLTNFQIIKKTGELTGNQIPEILAFDTANTLQYTYNNVIGLENGKIYTVKYQAFQGVKERGVPETDKDFPYQDPKAFYFTATATPPLCNGENGAIEILAWGGSGTYKYQLDNGLETAFPIPAVFDIIETTKQKIIIPADSKTVLLPNSTNNHSILVTDSKGCIDKTANN